MTGPRLTLTCSDAELDVLWPTALGLSLVTGTPFRLVSSNDGAPLIARAQHLATARVAAQLCEGPLGESLAFPADGEGRTPTSREVHLDVGGLGVAQTLGWSLPALSLAGGGTLHLRGATHPVRGPVTQTVSIWWPAILAAFSRRLEVKLERAGFAPKAGGALTAKISGARGAAPALVELLRRGTLREVRGLSLVAGGQGERAARQRDGVLAALRAKGLEAEVAIQPLPADGSSGGAVWLQADFEASTATFSAVALPGEPPEDTGARASELLVAFMASPGATDADSAALLLLWGALLADGRLGPGTPATTTIQAPETSPALGAIARAAEAFLAVQVSVDATGRCRVAPRTRVDPEAP